MPEICEVTLTTQYLTTKLLNRYITKICIVAGKYTRESLPGSCLIDEHKPLKIINIDNKGKFMWFELKDPNGNDIYILSNFGMTGNWSFYESKSDRVIFNIETHPNDHTINKIYKLHYADSRNFGILQITDNKNILDIKINKLAPDLLKSNFTTKEFIEWVNQYIKKSKKRYNVPIVVALLSQDIKNGIASGIGNYLSSEILYRAKISPYRTIGSLNNNDLVDLSNTIKKVIKLCYMSNITGYMKNLTNFVEKHKDKVKEGIFPDYHNDIQLDPNEYFKYLVYGREYDDLGNEIQKNIISKDRTTYWVPAIQK